MDCLVCSIGYANHIIGVKQALSVLQHVFFRNGIYVVDNNARSDRLSVSDNPVCNLVVRNTEVASHVPNNNFVTEHSPFSGLIKVLIQIPVKSECIMPNSTMQLQITESVFKGCILAKLRISSVVRRHLLHRRIPALLG